jgi:uncharacterized protein involved in cysteine biosynthesis
MISPAAQGFGHVLEGFRLIRRPGIRRYVLIPLLINMLLFGGVIYWGWGELERVQLWLDEQLPAWLEWLHVLIWPLFVLTALVVVFYLFTPVANLIGAPFNAFLAERLERDLGGEPSGAPGGGLGVFMKEALRALWGELRKLVYMVLWTIPLLVLFVIGHFVTLLLLTIGCVVAIDRRLSPICPITSIAVTSDCTGEAASDWITTGLFLSSPISRCSSRVSNSPVGALRRLPLT